MCTIKDVLRFLYDKAPDSYTWKLQPLIDAIYLADWKAAIDLDEPITDAEWQIINSRPIMAEDSFERVQEFIAVNSDTSKGSAGSWIQKYLMRQVKPSSPEGKAAEKLEDKQKKILEYVIDRVTHLTNDERKKLVLSTFPAISLEPNEPVNLSKLAKDYVMNYRSDLTKHVASTPATKATSKIKNDFPRHGQAT